MRAKLHSKVCIFSYAPHFRQSDPSSIRLRADISEDDVSIHIALIRIGKRAFAG